MQMQALQQQNAMQPNYYLPGQQNPPPPKAVPPNQQFQQPPAHTAMSPPPNSQQQPPYNQQPPPPQAQILPQPPPMYHQPPPPQAQILPRPASVYQQPPPPQAQTLPRPPPVYQQPPPPQAQTLPRPPPVYHQPPPPQVQRPLLMQQQTTQTVVIAPGATRVQVKQVSRQSSMNFTDNPSLPRRDQHVNIKREVYNRMPNTRQVWIKNTYANTVEEILRSMDAYKEGKVEKAVDCCCKTCWCGSDVKLSIEKNFQISRSEGGNVIKERLRASYKTIKEILIYYQFLFALANMILSVICLFENKWSVSTGEDIYEIIGFALSAVAFLYTSIDSAIHFFTYTVRCKSCYIWRNACRSNKDQKERSKEGCGKDPAEGCVCKCYKENCEYLENMADIVRLLVTECCFYFLLLLSIFQLIRAYVDRNIDDISEVDWALFGIGMAQDLGPVYICRVIILAGSLNAIQKIRNAEGKSENNSGVAFSVCFIAQAYGQLLIQIMMIFTISATYYHQYNNCSNFNMSSNASNTLLKMGCHCDTPVCHFSTGPLTKLVLNGFKLTI